MDDCPVDCADQEDPSPLTDDVRWAAMAACDKTYDGRFVGAVKTTGICCRPSCTARKPLRKNVLFFDTLADALKAGFRPCKRCRPDLLVYEPERELVERAKEAYDLNFDDPERLGDVIKGLSVSPNHLMRLFKQYEGVTRSQYLGRLRITKARELLDAGAADILQVALDCGFESVSNFYKSFKEQTGTTPARYRRKGGARQ